MQGKQKRKTMQGGRLYTMWCEVSVNCTTCSANSDLYKSLSTAQHSTAQHRQRAMLVGMGAILVQHLHALTCNSKLRNKLTVLCCLEAFSMADGDVL